MNNLEFFKFCQYMYRMGTPVVNDKVYDELYNELVSRGLNPNPRWEAVSDIEGQYLMKKYNAYITGNESSEIVFPDHMYLNVENAKEEHIKMYNEYKLESNRSIPIVTTNVLFKNIYDMFESNGVKEVLMALKLDGWNITVFVLDGYIVYAHTRGKLTTEVYDVTSLFKHMYREVDGKLFKKGYIVGEYYLPDSVLDYLRTKYNKPFKTTRNSISSFIHNKVIKEDLDLARFGSFFLNIEGENYNTVEEMYLRLQELGFEPAKYKVVKTDLPTIVLQLNDWSNQINHLPPSDGVVIQPNNMLIKNSLLQLPGISGSYDTGIYAIKMLNWGEQVYKTVVLEIEWTNNTKNWRPSLKVVPVVTRDRREITTVPIDHPGRLLDEDIYVGKEISLKVVSEKDIRLVYDEDVAKMRRDA